MTTSLYAPATVRKNFSGVLQRIPERFAQAGLAATCLLLGALAAFEPLLAVAGVMGLAMALIVLARPIVGLCALLLLSFLEYYSGLTGVLSLTKLLGGVLVLAWLAIVATTAREERATQGLLSREPLLGAALVVFTGWAAVSLVWAEETGVAQTSVERFVLNFMLFPIAIVAIRAPRHVIAVAIVFVVGALTASAFGLAEGVLSDADAENRLKGAGLNPNQLGSYLVVSMVFAATLATHRNWSPVARASGLVAATLAGLGVLLTLSRGALVGMAVALIVAPLVIGPGRRARALGLVVAALVGAVFWFAALAPANAVERVTSPEQSGGSGRTDLWRVGWRMVQDQPLQGVGAGNFPEASIRYLLFPGATQRDEFIVDDKKVAHNIYLTVLTELGVVGLSLFLLIIATCVRSALRAAHAFARSGDTLMELVARALLVSLLSLAVVGFFSSALYVKQLWILLAAAPALAALAHASGNQNVRRLPAALR